MHFVKAVQFLALFGLAAVLGAGLRRSQRHFKQDEECRVILGGDEPNGTFTSPNYPDDYPNDAACTWEMVVEEGSRVLLRFTDFHLEASFECSNDYLEIYNGESYDIYCGRNIPADIVSVGNTMSVVLVTDGLINVGDKFAAEYYTIEGNGGGDDNGTVTVPCGSDVDIGAEGYPYGVFYSPHHPDVYPDNVACRWNLLTEVDSDASALSTRVGFLRFRTTDNDEVTYDVDGVASDEIFSGNYQVWSNSSRVNMPKIMEVGKNNVSVTFNANGAGSSTGFLFAYAHQIPRRDASDKGVAPKRPVHRPAPDASHAFPAKNHVVMDFRTMSVSSTNNKLSKVAHFGDSHEHSLRQDNGTVDYGFFMSPNHPDNYANYERVSYEIIVEEGKRVALYPLRFLLETGYDFLYIKDAVDEAFEQRLTGEDPLDYVWVTTKSNQAEVIFTSDSSQRRYGFLFAVAAVDLD